MEPEAPVTSTVRIGAPYPLRGADGTGHRRPKTLTARPAGLWNANPGNRGQQDHPAGPATACLARPLQWIVQ